jgi:hypothetical protein
MENSNKPASDLYLVSRGQIQHILMSLETRFLWLMNIEAFMLGIYVGTSYFISPAPQLHLKAEMLNTTITYLGFIANVFALVDMVAGVFRMHKLRNNYMQLNNNCDYEQNYPALYGSVADRVIQGFIPIITVFFFLLIWLFIILYDHHMLTFIHIGR